MKLRLLEREFLVRVGRLRVANVIQFYSQPTLERIVGEKGTAEYKAQLAELQAEGVVTMVDKEPYLSSFRQIRLQGKEIVPSDTGELTERALPNGQAFGFFEAKPDYFIPVARGGFDIKFAAGATLPVSKSLQQTKTTEMYDRLIQLALGGIGYDPMKLGDALLKVNDFDPEEFKATQPPGGMLPEQAGMEAQMATPDMAQEENMLMLQGEEVGPTPNSSQEHTMVHIDFMNSPEFQELPNEDPIIKIVTDHVMGEIIAQQGRAQGQQNGEAANPQETIQSYQGQGTRANPPQFGGNQNNELGNMIPGLAQGGAFTPQTS